MPGIGYLTLLSDGSLKGPIDKFLSVEERRSLIENFSMKANSVMFFIANKSKKVAQKYAGQIRDYLGKKLDLIDENRFEFCIVKDFPLFSYDEEQREIEFCHNPFSLPHGGIKAYEEKDVLDILAYQYDIVCNGIELSSGAVRNHNPEIMIKAFEIAGNSPYLGMKMCVGCWLEGGDQFGDIIKDIHYFVENKKVFCVHFRNVSSTLPKFEETLLEDGYMDMYKVMKAFVESDYDGVIHVDHVPVWTESCGGSFL